jgi:hypothetical protein
VANFAGDPEKRLSLFNWIDNPGGEMRTFPNWIASPLLALAVCGPATATTISGVAGAIASSGACNDTKQVQANTSAAVRDTLELHAATSCNGQSASVDLRGDSATATIGIKASANGTSTGSSQAAGEVALHDTWVFTVAPGHAPQTFISIPVSITLEGNISSDAIFDPVFGRFLDYSLFVTDFYTNLGLLPSGKIATTGAFSQTFSGNVDLDYFGLNSLQSKLNIALQMDIVSLLHGTVDFYNTASISLDLPEGVSVVTSSGLPLRFGSPVVGAVPEPGTIPLLLAGLAIIGYRVSGRSRVNRSMS